MGSVAGPWTTSPVPMSKMLPWHSHSIVVPSISPPFARLQPTVRADVAERVQRAVRSRHRDLRTAHGERLGLALGDLVGRADRDPLPHVSNLLCRAASGLGRTGISLRRAQYPGRLLAASDVPWPATARGTSDPIASRA